MGILLDSSLLIAAERGQLDLDGLLASLSGEACAISAITASELLHGVHRAQTPGQRHRREAFVEQLLAQLQIVPFDAPAARVHAGVWAELRALGISLGVHDLLIAATALAIGFGVATCDARSFPRIPGLKVLLMSLQPRIPP